MDGFQCYLKKSTFLFSNQLQTGRFNTVKAQYVEKHSKVIWNHFLPPVKHQVGMKRGDKTEADAGASIFSDVIGYLKSKSSADETG